MSETEDRRAASGDGKSFARDTGSALALVVHRPIRGYRELLTERPRKIHLTSRDGARGGDAGRISACTNKKRHFIREKLHQLAARPDPHGYAQGSASTS